MRPDPQQTCEACGTAWFFPPCPIAMCRELQRLRKIEAAVESSAPRGLPNLSRGGR